LARIVGSDIAHAVPLTLLAGSGQWRLGPIDWYLLLTLLAGSIPGIVLGSYFAGQTTDHVLRMMLAVVLIIVAIRLGSRLIKPTMPGRQRDTRKRDNCVPVCHSGLRHV